MEQISLAFGLLFPKKTVPAGQEQAGETQQELGVLITVSYDQEKGCHTRTVSKGHLKSPIM